LVSQSLRYQGAAAVPFVLTTDNRVYIGDSIFNKTCAKDGTVKPTEEWVTVRVPPILSEREFTDVQAGFVARQPKRTPPRVVNGPTLLTGIARVRRQNKWNTGGALVTEALAHQ